MLTRREHAHTIQRSTTWRWKGLVVARTCYPVGDPYTIGFDQHDPANYPIVRWSLRIRVRDLTLSLAHEPPGM